MDQQQTDTWTRISCNNYTSLVVNQAKVRVDVEINEIQPQGQRETHINAGIALMLHGFVLRQPAFLLPHCHQSLCRYQCQHAQPRFTCQNQSLSRKVLSASIKRCKQQSTLTGTDSVPVPEIPYSDSTSTDARAPDEDLEDILSTMGSSLGLLPIFRRDQNGGDLKGVAVGGQQDKAIFVDLRPSKYVPRLLVDALQSNAVDKCGCFLRELYKHLLIEHKITMNGTCFDAHIALALLNTEENGIDDLVSVTTGSGEKLVRELLSNRSSSIPEYSLDHSISLCCSLTQVISALRKKLCQEGLLTLALRIEFPLIRVLGSMEIKGVPVDRARLESLKTECSKRLSVIEDEIGGLLTAHVSQSDRNNSPGKVFDACLSMHKKNKAYKIVARPTASRSELEMMGLDVNIPSDYRALANLFVQHEDLSKFIERDIVTLSRHLQSDGRVRTTFDQGTCATGRLSTRNPNLQNIPVRSQLGRELRSAFRADNGMGLLRADYSQIELRIVASLCGDPFLVDAFSSGIDIHRCIASKIFDVPTTDVTNIQRKQAKQVIYSILYGVSSLGLSERLAVPLRAAENLLSEFKIEFPSVQVLANQLIEEANKNGYAKTLLGRRLPLRKLLQGESSEKRAASRKAINMPIQGTQADMIKLAMVRIDERLRAKRATCALVLQVHDELILEVPDSEIEEVIPLVEEEMTSALPLTGVDVAVQIRYGPSWSSCDQLVSRG